MKNKLSTKILSLFLSILMVVTIVPMGTITAQAAQYSLLWPTTVRSITGGGGGYGSSRDNGRRFHSAIDIPASIGCPCYSVADGQVLFTGYYWARGNYVVIYHDKLGITSLYEHLNSYNVKSGNRVSRGQEIGKTGNSGYTTAACTTHYAAHLHFALMKGKATSVNYDVWKSGQTNHTFNPNPSAKIVSYSYDRNSGSSSSAPKVTVPDKPTITGISSTDIAKGKSVTIYWNASSRATSYNIAIRGAETRNIGLNSNARSCTFTLNNAGTNNIYVEAKNSAGTSPNNNCRVVTVHNPVNVKFIDWDGTELGYKGGQTVNYKESATPPTPPERKGYTFQGWSGTYQNVTSNQTVKATYKVNTYTVNFRDKDGKTLKSEKVEFGKDATAPTDTNTPTGYEFLGWDSENYKNVYTDASNKTININGIYQWKNKDLPVVCEVTSAKRQSDGYYVYFDLTNYPDSVTRGRAVVSLKTKTGKLVDASESAAFSIAKDGTKKGMEVFIPCDYVATNAEVIIVDSYSSGVPISEKVTASIDQGLMWSEWNTDKPDETDSGIIIESRTEYRYRNKETSKGNTKTKTGWIFDGTTSSNVGSWSGWSWNSVSAFSNESTKREVQTQSAIKSYNYKTVWNYYRWAAQYSGGYSSYKYIKDSHPNSYSYQFDSPLGGAYTTKQGVTGYKWYYNGTNWCALYPCAQTTSQVQTSANYATQYRYRDTNYSYGFYRWNNWSDWGTDEVSENDNRQVETRKTYRYKNNDAGSENDTGKEYTVSNKLDTSFAGKQITLFVYGYTGASDYTNQYIGQSTVGEDGSYSFTFKLRQEPTVETGDYTIAIGIEGTTNLIVVDKIEAPKPKYTVNFYDWDGTIIDTQTVTQGEDAVTPENPTREGYDFLGWDKSVANIKEDTDFYADFKKQEFTVIFVDWKNEDIKIEKFAYGDVLIPPEAESIEGKTFDGWDEIKNGNIIVKQDMVVRAKYETNTYTVKFYDFDGKVISTQEVEYGKSPNVPDTVEDSSDGKKFAGWFNPDDYENVKSDVAVYPSYYFDETTDMPSADYESGEYNDTIKLTLTSDDENAVIYYYLNDNDIDEKIYTSPITIDKTSNVSFYATSLGKNNSELTTNYYCINSSDKPSEWMTKSDIPQDVLSNLDNYNLESETGYRYKDLKSVTKVNEQASLEAAGWTLGDKTYTEYTSWQDEEITPDDSLIAFEIDTREVEDDSVVRYQYSHYKYTDSNGDVQYSPEEVEGYDCEYETVYTNTRLSISGFYNDYTTYYTYNKETWFKQTKVNGVKTQYRSRYQQANYYKWSAWSISSPSKGETRESETNMVFRYSNKTYHIVSILNGFDEYPNVKFVEDSAVLDTSEYELNGYDFESFYKDSEFTQKFDASTPITESVTLYAKYTPKVFTVSFQMVDGTEIDSQKVSYLESATAPATDAVPSYVFGGWDKDFSSVTEDMVVTGKYFKESEYTRVTLDRESGIMFTGTQLKLNASLTPEEFSNDEIEWTSSDPSIASVDDEGNVIANSAGEAVITVKVLKTKETATFTVTVKTDLEATITLVNNSYLNYDSEGYIRRVKPNTKVSDVVKQFANDDLSFVSKASVNLSDNDFVGTGTSVILKKGDETISKQFVVTADATGDGIINNRDVATINKYLLSKITLERYQIASIDVNGDGYVNNKDAAMVARYLVGKEAL